MVTGNDLSEALSVTPIHTPASCPAQFSYCLHLLEPLDPDREVLGLCLIYNLTSTLKPTAGVARLYLKIHASPPQGPPSASDSIHPARGPLVAWCSVLYFMPSLTPSISTSRLSFGLCCQFVVIFLPFVG